MKKNSRDISKNLKWRLPKGKLVAGLTGAIGSGKTAVCGMLRGLGACVVSTDAIAAAELEKGHAGYRGVVRKFGKKLVGPGGKIDRGMLASEIFSDRAKLRALEDMLHPLILRQAARSIRASREKIIVVEVPLLFERGMREWFDVAVDVDCGGKNLRRALSRGMCASDFRKRAAAQLSARRKAALSDIVIDNSGSLERTEKAVKIVFKILVSLANERSK